MNLCGFEVGLNQPLFLIAGSGAVARSLGTCDCEGTPGLARSQST